MDPVACGRPAPSECGMTLGDAVDPRVPWIRRIHTLDGPWATAHTARRERAVTDAATALGEELRHGPQVVSVRSLPTSDAPYPAQFAFNGALRSGMVLLRNRSLLVQVRADGAIRNVLFNPTDGPANLQTPYFARLATKVPSILHPLVMPAPNRCAQQLAALGLTPADIDVIAFDHFHTQDLRPLLGSDNLPARFPNAFLLAPRVEWDDWDDLPHMQRAWFVPDGKRGVPEDRVILTDHDLWLGEGALLLRTPGHTSGNQTLFVHGAHGVFGCSENGVCPDNWTPLASRMAAVRRHAQTLGVDVILNANTPEQSAQQYISMMLERSVVDRVPDRPGFVQMVPSSALTRSLLAPHIRPSVRLGDVSFGDVAAAR